MTKQHGAYMQSIPLSDIEATMHDDEAAYTIGQAAADARDGEALRKLRAALPVGFRNVLLDEHPDGPWRCMAAGPADVVCVGLGATIAEAADKCRAAIR